MADEDSQPNPTSIFSVRIVSIDYYMAPPIPDLDISYSSFQGGKVNEVPVIRIFGPTPAGQKTCLHVHKALPYLYVPCKDIPLQLNQEGDAYTNAIALALEKALKLKGKAGSKRQHVHACSLVRAKKFYGYHSSEELFVKIYLNFSYYPQDVSRAASLLLGGAVLDKILQPHESHVPFLLQFLVDYNLYGMGLLHISAMKFRHPLPDLFSGKKCKYNNKQLVNSPSASAHSQADSSSHVAHFSVWISSTVPLGWTWLDPQELSISPDQSYERFKRLSTCELEGDATAEVILNQHFKMFSSLSQTSSDVKMVQSLIPIWEEEYERNGMKEAAMPATHSLKPLAEDVLKYLSHGLEFEKKFMELCYEAESSSSPCQGIATGTPGKDEIQKPFPADSIDVAILVDTFHAKTSEKETLGLLKWLASSQAEEDINSDDDLACENYLSPLLPATTLNKVLEKANTDFEDESQKECRDILDSVEDSVENENIKRTEHSSADPDDSSETFSQSSSMKMVLQMDGPHDDKVSTPCGSNISAHEITCNLNRSSRKRDVQDKLQGITSRHNRNEQLWGSLPFSKREKKIDDLQPDMYMTNVGVRSSQAAKRCNSDRNREGCGFGTQATKADTDGPEAVTLVGCSLRDLMRRKRSSVHGSSEFQIHRSKRVLLTDHQRRDSGLCWKSELHSSESDEHDMKIFESSTLGASLPSHHAMSHQLCDAKPSCSTFSSDRNSSFGSDTQSSEKCVTVLPGPNVDDNSGSTMQPAISIHRSLEKENYEGTAGPSVECPRLFVEDSQERIQVQTNPIEINHSSSPKAPSGFPAHYLNDGSFLYLLTPSYSPPSRDSVCRWIVHNERGAVADPCNNGLDGDACLKIPALDPPDRLNDAGITAEVNDCQSVPKSPLQMKGDHDVKDHVDISQISGPEGKLKSTPLSQIGFKDPASVGCGQQLTLLSIEVLAESRGDLRPDPRYDAVNIVSMAIKHDADSSAVVYALLRSTDSYTRNLDGLSDCEVLLSSDEKHLFNLFVKIMCSFDPDILLGWDIQSGSLGFLAERASYLGITLLNNISRTPSEIKLASKDSESPEKEIINVQAEPVIADSVSLEDAIIEDEWGRTHASGVHVDGRVVLNIWRLMRGEVKLNMYTFEAVVDAVLRRKIPSIGDKVLTKWFSSGPCGARYKCIKYITDRAKVNLEIIGQLDMINRTSELARVFGIDFFSVLSRGSQYRVESMLLRLAHTQNYIAISPGNQQVASQPAMECLPLVMEPKSGFYSDPVVVLDFQSLYPSMIIGYNLCFCTCLGKVVPPKSNTLGVSSFSPESRIFKNLKNELFLTPNGVMYVPPKVRKGVLPRLLEEILSTRIMVKQALKNLNSTEMVLQRIFNARQLALKLIANVTYGYTAAGFSGRMPCAELADSIVQCGRRTLETAISFVHAKEKWKAKVIYGDTDSMFVLLEGRNVREAFEIGKEIASEISAMNPDPVTLKMEKVYHPCFLLTKKRYVGYSYERAEQVKPVFDAKGIETVRRDSCGAVAKTMEKSLRLFFEHQDIIKVKIYLQRQWTRILSGRVNIQDFVFAKEVRLGTYSTRTPSLPPAAIVATKAMRLDPRAEPRYGERVLYVVVHGEPGARLVDMVIDPLDLLAVDSAYRLNDLYYINKQIIPALQRVFGLVRADLKQWFLEMPRTAREGFGKRPIGAPNTHKKRIDYYYGSSHCILCGELVQSLSSFCGECSENKVALVTTVTGRTSKLERAMQHLNAICRHCGGGDWIVESGVKCTSLACSVFYERRKAQKELQILSSVATETGVYPKCMVEWF